MKIKLQKDVLFAYRKNIKDKQRNSNQGEIENMINGRPNSTIPYEKLN